LTDKMQIKVGLHQKTALSPILFLVIIDVIAEDINEDSPWAMLFADDLVLCDSDRERLERKLEIWRKKIEAAGLKISQKKTEHLPAVGDPENIRMTMYGSQEMESLPKYFQFKYLGKTIHKDGGCHREVELRISKAWSKWRELTGVLCNNKMPTTLKMLIYI